MPVRASKRGFALAAVVSLTAAVLLTEGCGDGAKAPSSASFEETFPKYAALPPQAVLIRVGGRILSKSDLESRIALRLKLLARRLGKPLPPKLVEAYATTLRESALDQFKAEVVFSGVAEREKLGVTEDMLARARKGLVREFGKKDETYARMSAALSASERALLDEEIMTEFRACQGRDRLLESCRQEVPDEKLEQAIADGRRYNAEMSVTNAAIFARATNVWERLVAKEIDFAETANRISEAEENDGESGGEWGTLALDEISDYSAELAVRVTNAAVGEILPPLEADNGLMIARLDGKVESERRYSISRIFFRLPEFWEELPREDLRKALAEEDAARAFDEEAKRLFAEVKFDYPQGTNILVSLKDISPDKNFLKNLKYPIDKQRQFMR